MNRFCTSLVLSTLAVLLLLALGKPVRAVPPAGFAYTVGTNFYVNGTQFHYGGDNIYWMGLLVMNTSQAEAESEMANCQAAGVKVVRIWAFSDGTSASLQPSLGVYNETALRVLD